MATEFPAYVAGEMTRPGAINSNASDPYALALTQFSGEILASFDKKRVLAGMVKNRTITKGRSVQFPLVGRAAAHYHTAGSRVNLDDIKSAQRTITVPGVITAATAIDDFESAILHYDSRQEYAKQLGEALANLREIHTAMILAQASHATKVIDDADQVDGRYITNDKFYFGTGGSTTKVELAAALCEALYMANVVMDEANVSEDGRVCALPSAKYYALLEGINGVAGFAVNREYGGMGSYADGTLPKIGGVQLQRSNAIPSTNIAQDTDNYKHYYGDFSQLVGMVFLPEAVGCVNLWDVTVEHDKQIDYLAEIVLAKHAYGLGILRPECSVALELDTLKNDGTAHA